MERHILPVELRWCHGISRWFFATRCIPWVLVILKHLKPPGLAPGDSQFNTVHPDSMQCLPASLQYGPGWSLCPQSSRWRYWDNFLNQYVLIRSSCCTHTSRSIISLLTFIQLSKRLKHIEFNLNYVEQIVSARSVSNTYRISCWPYRPSPNWHTLGFFYRIGRYVVLLHQ